MYKEMSEKLKAFGGHLECSICHKIQELDSVEDKSINGWPVCCGYTMTWITKEQEVQNEN